MTFKFINVRLMYKNIINSYIYIYFTFSNKYYASKYTFKINQQKCSTALKILSWKYGIYFKMFPLCYQNA